MPMKTAVQERIGSTRDLKALGAIRLGIRAGFLRQCLAIKVPQFGKGHEGIEEPRGAGVTDLGGMVCRGKEIGFCQCGSVFMEEHRRERDRLLIESSTGARRMLGM